MMPEDSSVRPSPSKATFLGRLSRSITVSSSFWVTWSSRTSTTMVFSVSPGAKFSLPDGSAVYLTPDWAVPSPVSLYLTLIFRSLGLLNFALNLSCLPSLALGEERDITGKGSLSTMVAVAVILPKGIPIPRAPYSSIAKVSSSSWRSSSLVCTDNEALVCPAGQLKRDVSLSLGISQSSLEAVSSLEPHPTTNTDPSSGARSTSNVNTASSPSFTEMSLTRSSRPVASGLFFTATVAELVASSVRYPTPGSTVKVTEPSLSLDASTSAATTSFLTVGVPDSSKTLMVLTLSPA